jgi:hypothetical protein
VIRAARRREDGGAGRGGGVPWDRRPLGVEPMSEPVSQAVGASLAVLFSFGGAPIWMAIGVVGYLIGLQLDPSATAAVIILIGGAIGSATAAIVWSVGRAVVWVRAYNRSATANDAWSQLDAFKHGASDRELRLKELEAEMSEMRARVAEADERTARALELRMQEVHFTRRENLPPKDSQVTPPAETNSGPPR